MVVVGIPKIRKFLYRAGKRGYAKSGESEVSLMQNQFNDQKKARNQTPAPQDCKDCKNSQNKQEQPQDKTGGPNRH